jgi:hypothetical protein
MIFRGFINVQFSKITPYLQLITTHLNYQTNSIAKGAGRIGSKNLTKDYY